ncbi:VOC family protein [Microbacterium resistens]|uniref:VOC family protein n=1 Tax=Microbacterium resistens TaxID=156977 RepID=UPI00366BA28A
MSHRPYGQIAQLGYVVEDIEDGIRHWSDALGVGPWTLLRNVTIEGVSKGEPTVVTMDVALGYQGEIQIELIQQTSPTPSPYRGPDGVAVVGAHHVAWLTEDLDESVRRAETDGCTTIFRAENPGSRVAYLTLPGEEGARIEFIESAAAADMIRVGIAASKDWDGRDPVQEIDFAATIAPA